MSFCNYLQLLQVSYPERLKILDLTTLESRRLRGDLIEVFKIVKGFITLIGIYFFTETLEFVGGIVKNYISILLTWMFENFRLAKELLIIGMH